MNLLRSISRRLAFALVAVLAVVAVVVVFPSSASAATTQKSSCKDKGKHLWKARTVWGAEYRDAGGVKRISNNAVGFTSAAPDATTVDYSVKGYDGAGKLIYSVTASDRVYNFKKGTRYLTRNPRNPPSAKGKAKIVIHVGDGNDGFGNCTMTFIQPCGMPRATPARRAPPRSAPITPGTTPVRRRTPATVR